MKRVILLSGILIMFFSASDIFAQGKERNDRDWGYGREDVRRKGKIRNKEKGSDFERYDRKTKANATRDRFGRELRVVDRRTYKNNRGRSFNTWNVSNRSSRVYYDYDFRKGRRIVVNRGSRPTNRHIWVSGYWSYDRRLRRDAWVGGHWSIRRSFHYWVPGHYQIFEGARIWIEECWTIR